MTLRYFWVLTHRYVGLTMTLLLFIVGATGSLLAFYHELDRWLNPALLTVPVRETPRIDPLALRERAEAMDPRIHADSVVFSHGQDEAAAFWVQARKDPNTGEDYVLPYTEIYLDPYTGQELGRRKFGEVSLTRENILSFLYRLHYSLALPESTGNFGGYVLGVTALLWSLDCFVGFYLTLPAGKKKASPMPKTSSASSGSSRSYWQRWKPAWRIKPSRFNYDLHRASGLWLWPMLFVFAWSSVGFNLQEVYSPVMRTLFSMKHAELPERKPPMDQPKLDWHQAYAQGQHLMQDLAKRHGFLVEQESSLALDRTHGVYQFTAKTDTDWSKHGFAVIAFDADNGNLKSSDIPGLQATGDVISRWLYWLHMAQVFGLPMQIFVSCMGIVIVSLAITGIVIWWRKRRSAKHQERRRSTNTA